jgi:RNA polymerase sigma-70 factor (ECF subfamily)
VAEIVSADARSWSLSVQGSGKGVEFELWYQAEFGRLARVMIRLGVDREDAADLAGEAFSRALQRWSSVSEMESPTGWVYRVAFNVLHRLERRRALERRVLAKRSVPVPRHDVPVWDAVAQLPLRQRTAVVLHYLLDLPIRQVASVMSVKEGTVAATLAAARRALQPVLDDREDPP